MIFDKQLINPRSLLDSLLDLVVGSSGIKIVKY